MIIIFDTLLYNVIKLYFGAEQWKIRFEVKKQKKEQFLQKNVSLHYILFATHTNILASSHLYIHKSGEKKIFFNFIASKCDSTNQVMPNYWFLAGKYLLSDFRSQ